MDKKGKISPKIGTGIIFLLGGIYFIMQNNVFLGILLVGLAAALMNWD